MQSHARSPLSAGRVGRRLRPLIVLSLVLACSAEPDLSPEQAAALVRKTPVPVELVQGERLYADYCSPCHGRHGEGSDHGPPMLHAFQARQHGDFAFHRAIDEGVRPHHYRFGSMPPVSGLPKGQVESVVAYIRWMQHSAGLRE